jgi:carbon storage regulator
MLVVTRKKGQTLVIGKEVQVIIMEVRGNQVQLGIKAPTNFLRKDSFRLDIETPEEENPETSGHP